MSRSSRGRRRAAVAVLAIGLWLAGIGLLVGRQYFQPNTERLAQAGMRVNPGAVYYGVMQGNQQIGFASSTIDTVAKGISIRDYLVANLPMAGKLRRTVARTDVLLSRSFRVREFTIGFESDAAPLQAGGRVDGDSVLTFWIANGKQKPDTQRVHLDGPVLVPTVVPLAVALGEEPKVGRELTLPVFDPVAMQVKQVPLHIDAESLFVLSDSAVYDSAQKVWRPTADTLRAWSIAAQGTGGFSGWVDNQGRVVETQQLNVTLKRMPYEVAWYGWKAADRDSGAVTAERDILESTAIAANKRLTGNVQNLALRVGGADLRGYDVESPFEHLVGDVLRVMRPPDDMLDAQRIQPGKVDTIYLRSEPLIQAHAPEIRALVGRIVGPVPMRDYTPRQTVERLARWVHDSVAQKVTFGVPDALQVLHTRSGDCNEHTQLFVAMARTAGIPARVVAGLAYTDGKFYYHVWPEVLLRTWVPVDPTFGQVPADASHIRLVVGGLGRQAELLRLMGNLQLTVLSRSNTGPLAASTLPSSTPAPRRGTPR